MYAFEGDEIIELWKVWVRERKAYAKGQYTLYAQQRAMNKLQKLSGESIEAAQKIIDQSITNAWKDFFPLREQRQTRRPNLDADSALKWASQ